ncbi:MAG: hypothetical protein ACOZF2_06025 [Thermodesulfobacteriota bacterium]
MTEKNAEIAVRSHDVLVTSGIARAAEFDSLINLGAAVRLAINLRGMPPVRYDLLRDVAVHRLGLQPSEVRPAIDLLAEAEMVDIDAEGKTYKTVLPNIPFFSDLYSQLGEVGTEGQPLNEHEQLTIELMERLARRPQGRNDLAALGADRRALRRVLEIGESAGFVMPRRVRGQDIFISPSYFAEDPQALADLTVTAGGTRLERVLNLLKQHQGYPLRAILRTGRLAGNPLDPEELKIIQALAGQGFLPPPAIRTTHAGENHFIFGPQPGVARLAPHEVQIYRNALALVSAVRQGQCLARAYAIKYPKWLLEKFRDRGFLRRNSEAPEQYRAVVQLGIARLVPAGGNQATLQLIRDKDNLRTVDHAIRLIEGSTGEPTPDEELMLAMKKGEEYVEPLLARKSLAACEIVTADRDVLDAIDQYFLMRGGS